MSVVPFLFVHETIGNLKTVRLNGEQIKNGKFKETVETMQKKGYRYCGFREIEEE